MESVFRAGKEVIESRHGPYENEPEEFGFDSGLLDEGRAAHTDISFSTKKDGPAVYYDRDVNINGIVVDADLYEDRPEDAAKSLIHELLEWHAIERMTSDEVMDGKSHTVAKYNDKSVCREVNQKLGEQVCNPDWNDRYDT